MKTNLFPFSKSSDDQKAAKYGMESLEANPGSVTELNKRPRLVSGVFYLFDTAYQPSR